jgi:hypothetical protein
VTLSIRPTLQALLVADHIYTDHETQKKVVAGIFHQLITISPSPPASANAGEAPISIHNLRRAGSPFAYASLTDVRGKQEFVLRYVDLGTDNVIFQYEIEVQSDDPLASAELAIPLPLIPSSKEGTFALELLWNNEPLGSYRIQVKSQKLHPQPGDTTDDDSSRNS